MSRVIRFKEWGCGRSFYKRPSEKQLQSSTQFLQDKDYVVRTDVNGFIINGILNDRENRNKSMVVLGDSFVESLFVDEDKRFTSVLERKMPQFNVLNGGYSGSTSLHILNIIVNKIIPLSPDYVMIFLPTNDQRVQNIEHGYWNKDPRLSPLVSLSKKESLNDDYASTKDLYSVHKILKLIHFALQSYGVPHCFVTTPHRSNVGEDDEWMARNDISFKRYANKVKQRKAVNYALRRFCSEYSIDCIDLERRVHSSELFYDDLHLCGEAGEVVGEILISELSGIGAGV